MTPEDMSKYSLERFQEAKKEFDNHMQDVDAKSVFCCYAMNQIVRKVVMLNANCGKSALLFLSKLSECS